MTEDKKTWDQYLAALKNWKATKNKSLAEITTYFGEEQCKLMEEIQEDLHDLEQKILATFYDRKRSVHFLIDKKGDAHDFRKKFFPVWDQLEPKIVTMVQEMISMIQKEDVGTLKT